jgi:hypothetical protein
MRFNEIDRAREISDAGAYEQYAGWESETVPGEDNLNDPPYFPRYPHDAEEAELPYALEILE